MQVIPAIDLRGGQVVRLRQGDYGRQRRYSGDGARVGRGWAAQGAARVHLVDLDGAAAGRPVQLGAIARAIAAAGVPCHVGGGIRDLEAARAAQAAGADRVVLATSLLDGGTGTAALVAALGPAVVVASLDVRGGLAVGEAWRVGAAGQPWEAALERLLDLGVRIFAMTAIERDGMLRGPDLELLERARARLVGAQLIAAGGVGGLADLTALAQLGCDAVIVGRALYERRFSLAQALDAAAAGGAITVGAT